MPRQIFLYETISGKKPFVEWISNFKDKKIISRIYARLDRLIRGNFGDTKAVGRGVLELRFHFGPGYRVYFALGEDVFIVLLCGGDKSSQHRDIKRAQQYWNDYLRRQTYEEN